MAPSANLILRFLLELAAVAGFGMLAWQQAGSWARIPAALLACGLVLTLWGVFAVPDDPSRSGNAPVPVPGWLRLVLELTILFGGSLCWSLAGFQRTGAFLAGLIILHYALSLERLRWLLRQ